MKAKETTMNEDDKPARIAAAERAVVEAAEYEVRATRTWHEANQNARAIEGQEHSWIDWLTMTGELTACKATLCDASLELVRAVDALAAARAAQGGK